MSLKDLKLTFVDANVNTNRRGSCKKIALLIFACFDYLRPSQQLLSYVETCLPGLNQYLAADQNSIDIHQASQK